MQGKLFSRVIIDYNLKEKKGPLLGKRRKLRNLTENESEVRNPTYQPKDMESKSLLKHGASFDSEASKIDFKTPSKSQEYNIPSNQKKGLNEQNFITLSKITEQERIEIIQTGFQLNQEGKISLKKYYESREEYSLYQLKGYSIKYETIRRTKLYQQLKP